MGSRSRFARSGAWPGPGPGAEAAEVRTSGIGAGDLREPAPETAGPGPVAGGLGHLGRLSHVGDRGRAGDRPGTLSGDLDLRRVEPRAGRPRCEQVGAVLAVWQPQRVAQLVRRDAGDRLVDPPLDLAQLRRLPDDGLSAEPDAVDGELMDVVEVHGLV